MTTNKNIMSTETWSKVNHIPMTRKLIPGKLVTFGEGSPVAKVVEQTGPNTVKIELIKEIVGLNNMQFPVGHVAELMIEEVRYLE